MTRASYLKQRGETCETEGSKSLLEEIIKINDQTGTLLTITFFMDFKNYCSCSTHVNSI